MPVLREFIEPVPQCLESVELATAFDVLLHSGKECLVLLNTHGHTVGFVRLQRLVSRWLMPESSDKAALNSLNPPLIEPLLLLPADLSIAQFLPYLPSSVALQVALTNQHGEVLGLLDQPRLLKCLATNLTDTDQSADRSPQVCPPLSSASQATGLDHTKLSHTNLNHHEFHHEVIQEQQRQIARLTQQLLVQKTELEMQVKLQQDKIEHLKIQHNAAPAVDTPILVNFSQINSPSTGIQPSPLQPLLDLLERLPLPLMLQTSQGLVLAQNSTWCKQIGELTDPFWLQREAAAILENSVEDSFKNSLETSLGLHTPWDGEQATQRPALEPPLQLNSMSAEPLAAGLFEGTSNSVCHLGTKPGSCVCVCPLKNGQEQVLQFVKISIGTFSSYSPLSLVDAALNQDRLTEEQWQTSSDREMSQAFRLAMLAPTTGELSGLESDSGRERLAPSAHQAHESSSSSTENCDTLWLILAQDVTEQEQLAKELAAKNADLIQLNRLKDEFLACISHELRTPLTAVLGLSTLLKDQMLGELNQRQVHYAQLIYQSGRHLMAVVNDILDLTRTETGQLELDLEPVHISTLCNRAYDQAKQLQLLDKHQSLTAEADHLQPQFSLEIEPGLELLTADELRLRQMLIHLLANALKFTEPDQQIGLKVGCWGGWIAFTIWDTGIGIPADKQHLIFQKFQQLENPLTRRYEGTGLGLVLTQRLARLHGGDVTFISKEGRGSQFTILLPPSPPDKTQLASGLNAIPSNPAVYPANLASLQVPSPLPPWTNSSFVTTALGIAETQNQLVLIVEAVPQFIEALSEQLVGLGYRVVVARSGTEAVEKARRLQPCIILLNPVLPLLSGWDVLTLLKSKRETQKIPIVVTATKVDEAHAHHYHADGLLSLPVQVKALQQCLNRLVIEPADPEPQESTSSVLTVLRLSPSLWVGGQHSVAAAELNQLLHLRRYRVLEADDLEQAELLARVWKPNVVLLDGIPLDLATYFQQFSQRTFLASLPLVTLDQETTQAANQVPGLLVFPCLASLEATLPGDSDTEPSALLQVIQVAAGYTWKPSILALDTATLSVDTTAQLAASHELGTPPREVEWLQALTQYLQTAGFRGLVGRSWQEVVQQLQSQSIDLLLVCWTEAQPRSTTLEMLSTLQALAHKPPILVLDHRSYAVSINSELDGELPPVLKQLAAHILPPSLPMAELLNYIQQTMKSSEEMS